MTRQHHNTRTCPACSKPLERKTRPDGRPETPKQWAERKYCDRRCRDKAMTQAKNALKKAATLAEDGVVVIDGEIVPGASWEAQEDSVSFSVREEAAS